jgi:NAD(P)-dependent dehydrogenase (short-subunit alcohol dehydrogenase family)
MPAMAKWTVDDIPDQSGRTVVVTGANSGLGLRSAEALARHGARVLLACRNPDKAATALDDVRSLATGAPPEVVALDLADLASVRGAADDIAGRVDRLDTLMNNAGVMALPKRATTDGFEMQFGTNHFGHFALTGWLLPLLMKADAPRVVTVASQGHRMGRMRWDDFNWEHGHYSKWLAYGQSKLANLLFAFELDRRARAAGTSLVSVAAHPGYAATNLSSQGPQMTGNSVMGRLSTIGDRLVAQSDAMGALPQLYAATMPDVCGGEYFGPDGFFESRGHPKRVVANSAARREEDGRRLWEASEAATGVTYDWRS